MTASDAATAIINAEFVSASSVSAAAAAIARRMQGERQEVVTAFVLICRRLGVSPLLFVG